MTISSENADRRVQRTRRLLRQASIDVLQEKGFSATSIQEITKRANVNRGTFYAYYPDKYALLEELIREEFQRLVVRALPPLSQWSRRTLYQLIQMVLRDFKNVYHQCHPRTIIDPLIERVIREELTALLLAWLKQREKGATQRQVPAEMMAQSMSWAIVGTAIQWSQEIAAIPAEQIAENALLIMMEGIAHLAPDVLAE